MQEIEPTNRLYVDGARYMTATLLADPTPAIPERRR
jgi:hypothetical protein